jgi:O-antigen/teichoic acid export membrane protein
LNALSLPAMAFIIRKLGPTAYGEWSVATSLIATLSFLANFGLRAAFVRTVARDPDTAPTRFAEQLGLRSTLSIMTVGIALGICLLLRYSTVIVACTGIAGIGLILGVVAGVAVDYLQALHRLMAVAVINFIAGLCLTMASVVAVWKGGGPILVSWSYLIGPTVSVIALLGLIGYQEFAPRVAWNLSRFRALIAESRFFIAQQGINIASAYAAALLLPKIIGTTEFGFYTAGTLLVTRLGIIPDALSSAFFPIIAKAYHGDVYLASRKAFYYLGLSLLMSLPVAWAVFLMTGLIARILFPGRELQCLWIMKITIWMLPLMSVGLCLGYSLNAAGYEAQMTRMNLRAAICQIALTVALIYLRSTSGACWALVLRYIVTIVFLAPLFLKVFPLTGILRRERAIALA